MRPSREKPNADASASRLGGQLVEIDTRPLGKPTSLTPLSHCLFRPEEQHGRSGVKDVIPPMCRWHRKMDDT